MAALTLVSHHLCPYVQRVAIALSEKGVAHERRMVDLSQKPDWFLALSPLGKTPVLVADGEPIFESAVILEYLEETEGPQLHPKGALARARDRGWIEFASAVLSDIAGLYSARDEAGFLAKAASLRQRFERLDAALGQGPWFAGETFGLVDAGFAPVFRYLDAFDRIGLPDLLTGLEKVRRWRRALAGRPSVRGAVAPDYPQRLDAFLRARGSWLSGLMPAEEATAA